MARWLMMATLVVTLGLAPACPAAANFTVREGFGSLVRRAEIVARVRITAIRSVVAPDNLVCGALYSATVVESFKGPSAPFEFFNGSELFFESFQQDYFVAASGSDEWLDVDVSDIAEDATAAACATAGVQSVPYVVFAGAQMIYAFDMDLQEETGEEWLRTEKGNPIETEDYPPKMLDKRNKAGCRGALVAYRWADVRNDLLKWLAGGE